MEMNGSGYVFINQRATILVVNRGCNAIDIWKTRQASLLRSPIYSTWGGSPYFLACLRGNTRGPVLPEVGTSEAAIGRVPAANWFPERVSLWERTVSKCSGKFPTIFYHIPAEILFFNIFQYYLQILLLLVNHYLTIPHRSLFSEGNTIYSHRF